MSKNALRTEVLNARKLLATIGSDEVDDWDGRSKSGLGATH